MFLYAVLYPITTAMTFFLSTSDKQRAFALIAIGFTLSLLVGLRAPEVGMDTVGYYDLYNKIIAEVERAWVEKQFGVFFTQLSLFANAIGSNATFITLTYATITIFLTFVTIYRYSVHITTSLAIFLCGLGLFFFMHNGMRQALAISIVFYSIHYIFSRQWLSFYLTTFAACIVHLSAVFFIPFYYLAQLKVRADLLFICWLVSTPFVFIPSLSGDLISLVAFIIPNQYTHYIGSAEMYSAGGMSGFGLIVLMKQLIFLLVLYAYKMNLDHPNKRIIYLLFIYFVILQNLTVNLGLLGRVNAYLGIFIILALPMAIKDLVIEHERPLVFFSTWILICIIYLYEILGNGHGIFPYSMIYM